MGLRGMATGLLITTLVGAPPALAAVPAGNLVHNPGAEAIQGADSETAVVPPPEWGTTSNFTAVRYGVSTFPGTAVSDGIGGETNFFAGGPNNASSLAEQVIDVSE